MLLCLLKATDSAAFRQLPMRILLIDNYDSFTYNLVHMLEMAGGSLPEVRRNDKIGAIDTNEWDAVVLSPGPGLPAESGQLMSFLQAVAGRLPVLGICLGHQALVEHFGGRLRVLPKVMHGVSNTCSVAEPADALFSGLPSEIRTGHYHSWVADEHFFPDCLRITASDKFGIIQAMAHRELNVRGLQFHPESVLTPDGFAILCNWVTEVS